MEFLLILILPSIILIKKRMLKEYATASLIALKILSSVLRVMILIL